MSVDAEQEKQHVAEVLAAGGHFAIVDEVTWEPDEERLTTAEELSAWRQKSTLEAEQARKDRAVFEGNRSARRAREREDRRAAKLATIQQITRGIR